MSRMTVAILVALALVAGCAAPGDGPGTAETERGTAGEDSDVDGQSEEADAGDDDPDEASEDADSPDLLVVATLAPLADVVERILGDRGRVETLVPQGMDAHSYEPRPRDVEPLAEADAFFGNGLSLNDAAVELAEANLPEAAPLVLLGEETLHDDALSRQSHHTHGDDDGHSHGDDSGHGHSHDDDSDDGHTHDDGDVNPHVWTSVPHVEAYASGVADALAEIDPDGADAYQERLEHYLGRLTALHDAIEEAVASIPPEARRLVTYHDAWVYFGETYGLEVIAAVQPSDFSEPSAADVRAIIDQIHDEGVPAVFGSEEFPNDVVTAITAETGADYVGDLADDVLPAEPGDPEHSYVGMMRRNAVLITEALGGDPSPLDELELEG